MHGNGNNDDDVDDDDDDNGDEERKEITNPEHFQLQFDAIIAS